MSNTGTYTWTIGNHKYGQMMNANVGEEFQSGLFDIAGLKWRCDLFPNGQNSEYEGSFDLFLTLMQMPSNFEYILVQMRMECIETCRKCVSLEKYDRKEMSYGFPHRNQILDEIKNMNLTQISFKMNMKIIRIVSLKKEILFSETLPIKSQNEINLNINQINIRKSTYAKGFETELKNDSMFIIGGYPNSNANTEQIEQMENEGNLSVYLQMVHLGVHNAAKVEVKFTFLCQESNAQGTYTYMFSVGAGSVWDRGTFCSLTLPNINIKAAYEILNIFDENNNKIDRAKWNANNSTYDYNQTLFPMSLSSSSDIDISVDIEMKNDESTMDNTDTQTRKKKHKKHKKHKKKCKSKQNKKENSPNDEKWIGIESINNTLDWTQKALLILETLLKFDESKPFQQCVDEERDNAPDYYSTIEEAMDLNTLKTLIENKTITGSQSFVSNLMLIWENAQSYNVQTHEIYQFATKLKNKSNKLIKQYWPNAYKTLYECKRRSQRIKNQINTNANNIARVTNDNCLECTHCEKRMTFLRGFDINCECVSNEPKCNECQSEITNAQICYYHCHNGHSVFLCEICAEKSYDLKQYHSFYGCFLDLSVCDKELFYEAIVMKCEADRIFYTLIFSTETEKRYLTEAELTDFDKLEVIGPPTTDFTKGILSEDGLKLTFIDTSVNNSAMLNNENTNTMEKIRVFCRKCKAETMFMLSDMTPNIFASSIWCDTHSLFYETQKLLQPNQRCKSFKLLSEECNDNICRQDFYYSCVNCNDFDQCGMCTLIQYEIKFRNENIMNEPSQKRQKINNAMYIERNTESVTNNKKRQREDDGSDLNNEYEKLKQMYILEKRKNQELNDLNGRLNIENDRFKSELEIYQLHNQSFEMKCSQQLNTVREERDQCRERLNQFKQNIMNVCHSCNISEMN